MKPQGPFAAGNDAGKFDVALQRPTVDMKEAENVGEQLAGVQRRDQPTVTFSRHGTFGPKKTTHPGLE